MNQQINAAIQVLPRSKDKHPYDIVDKAIEIIKTSGLKYQVCPFETVVEGTYAEVMTLVEKVHAACYAAGTEDMMCYLKIQSSSQKAVTIDDKMNKYK
ncbi:MAG TPA: thiamine-binding protein [Bacteroidales bacterium]|nr:thiamine-binding protein [Bacteroidales bacterium]